MKKIILALAALSLTASPAFAMATRPVVKVATVDPATLVAPRNALYAEYDAFSTCAYTKAGYSAARSANEFAAIETALNTAGVAAKAGNLTTFNEESATFRSLLAALKAKWGC